MITQSRPVVKVRARSSIKKKAARKTAAAKKSTAKKAAAKKTSAKKVATARRSMARKGKPMARIGGRRASSKKTKPISVRRLTSGETEISIAIGCAPRLASAGPLQARR